MTLITQTIENLIGGVSQQTPSLRRANQCEQQENCRNDPVEGMGKRYSTQLEATIAGLTNPGDYTFQFIDRDDQEKYIMAVKDGDLRVFDKLTGFEYNVNKPAWSISYLANRGTRSAQRSYQIFNTIDTTFILNKTVPVRYKKLADDGLAPEPTEQRLVTLSFTRHPVPEKDDRVFSIEFDNFYRFVINGQTYRYERAEDSLSRVIAAVNDWILQEYPAVTLIRPTGSTLEIVLPPNEDISISGTAVGVVGDDERLWNILQRQDQTTQLVPIADQAYTALWYIKQADYSTEYDVVLDGNVFNIKTPDATSDQARAGLETRAIASQLAININGDPDYQAAVIGSVLAISRVDGADFTIQARDDLGDNAAIAIKEFTASFEDLPPSAPLGYRVEIRGSLELDVEPYHVQYRESTDSGVSTTGYWEETHKAGIDLELDGQTMPISLNRKQDVLLISQDNPLGIYFDLEETEWFDRTVGDDVTAPMPSFCSELDENGLMVNPRYIYNMTYYRNRLALLSDENIIFSEAGEFLNFFPTTVISVLDGDVIDISLPLDGTEPAEWSLEDSQSLMIFTPKRQLRLTGGEVFNAQSIVIDVASSYAVDLSVRPFSEGAFLHFWDRGTSTAQLNEYARDGDTETWVAQQVTSHIPQYIKGNVRRTEVSSTERMMITSVTDALGGLSNTLIVYNYLWDGGRKVQNAWQTWRFKGKVVDINIELDILYIMFEYEDGTVTIESMNLSEDFLTEELGHAVYLDQRQEVDSSFSLPGSDEREIHTFQGRYFVGYPYEQLYVFSELYPRNNEGRAMRGGRLQVRYLYLNYSDTTQFKVIVERQGRVSKTLNFTGRVIGSLQNLLGQVPVESGQYQARIQSRSSNVKVTLINDSVFDAVFQTTDWEGTYVNRARRA